MLLRLILMILLFPLKSINYIRRRFEKKIEFKDKFIISVGNLSFGGSGKTPLVIEIARFFEELGIKTAVFLRGYKGEMENIGGKVKLSDKTIIWGDEAILIKRNINSPVFVGKNRIKQIKSIDNLKIKILIFDDGFQYFKIKKDLDIIIYDFKDPSPLARDFKSELKKADIIFNKSGQRIEKTEDYIIVFDGIYDCRDNKINDYSGKEFTAFSGIGTPESFKKTLSENNIKYKQFITYPDHYFYKQKDIDKLVGYNSPLITTEKDFVKLKEFNIRDLYYLKIRVKLKDKFKKELVKKFEEKNTL